MALKTQDFAVTGVSGSGRITYTFTIRVTENSTNTVLNSSNVTVQAILKQTYSGTAFSSYRTGVSCTVNGTQLFSDYCKRSITGTAEHVYYTWTGDMPHNVDGTLVLNISGQLWQTTPATYTPPTMTVQGGVMELTRIPRTSTVGASDASVGSRSTVVITRASDSFTHTLAYSFGTLSGYIGADGQACQTAESLKGTTVSFLIPEDFYAQIPNAAYGTCTLTCTTYSGSTAVGSATAAFRVTAAESLCGPLAQCSALDVNAATVALTGNSGVLVRYMSTARCTLSAQARCSATLQEKKIAGVTLTGNTLDITGAESGSIAFSVKDSRGYTASGTAVLPMVYYVQLTNNAIAARTAPTTGQAMLAFSGNCFNGSFGKAANTLTLRYRICPEGGSYGAWQTQTAQIRTNHTYYYRVDLTGLDYTKSYTVQTQATDALNTVSKTLTVQQGIPVYNWNKERFFFHVPVECDGAVSGAYIRKHTLQNVKSVKVQATPGQTLFLFGGGIPVWGAVYVGQSSGVWTGTQGVSAQAAGGVLTLTFPQSCTGDFLFISAQPFSIE